MQLPVSCLYINKGEKACSNSILNSVNISKESPFVNQTTWRFHQKNKCLEEIFNSACSTKGIKHLHPTLQKTMPRKSKDDSSLLKEYSKLNLTQLCWLVQVQIAILWGNRELQTLHHATVDKGVITKKDVLTLLTLVKRTIKICKCSLWILQQLQQRLQSIDRSRWNPTENSVEWTDYYSNDIHC